MRAFDNAKSCGTELTLLGFIGLLVYSVQRADLLNDLSSILFGEAEADFLPEMTGEQ